jgi:hypothetical protein
MGNAIEAATSGQETSFEIVAHSIESSIRCSHGLAVRGSLQFQYFYQILIIHLDFNQPWQTASSRLDFPDLWKCATRFHGIGRKRHRTAAESVAAACWDKHIIELY